MRPLIRATALSLLLIATFTVGSVVSNERVHAIPGSFTLFGRIGSPVGWGFTSSTVTTPGPDITVQPGESVDAIISSSDGAPHNWGVDYNGNGNIGSGEPLTTTITTGTSFTFTATTTPGVYTYWCFIHKGPMNGRFIVGQPDFVTNPSPPALTIDQGTSQTSTLTVSSLNGFSGTVTFTTPTTPAGITAVLNANSVMVTPSSPGTTIMNVTATSNASPGTYLVNVTATASSSLSHATTLSLTVSPTSSPSPAASIPASELIIIGAVIVASVFVVAYAV